ncbi:MAG: YhfC family glutamic-type intramembrane protease, partial [Eubacterium sp.]
MTKMFLMANAFSKNSMMGMVIVALVCMGIPFIVLAYMKTKTGAKITSFLKGMLFYALFAFGASGIINILLFGGLSLSSILNRNVHPVYYALYGAVLAGIIEELGKYI